MTNTLNLHTISLMSIHIKSSTIRRLTRLAKSLHPLMQGIPKPLPRPGSTAHPAPRDFSATEAQKRQEAFNRADARRLDKGVIRFFAQGASWDDERRVKS